MNTALAPMGASFMPKKTIQFSDPRGRVFLGIKVRLSCDLLNNVKCFPYNFFQTKEPPVKKNFLKYYVCIHSITDPKTEENGVTIGVNNQ